MVSQIKSYSALGSRLSVTFAPHLGYGKGRRVVNLWRFGGFQKQAGGLLLIPVARGWYNLYNTAAKDIALLCIGAHIIDHYLAVHLELNRG